MASELPDAIRVPLDSLEADAGYLMGRVAADGACAGEMAESVRRRTKEIRTAIEALEESVAKAIYEQWANVDGWKPWVPGGNSLLQGVARQMAYGVFNKGGQIG